MVSMLVSDFLKDDGKGGAMSMRYGRVAIASDAANGEVWMMQTAGTKMKP